MVRFIHLGGFFLNFWVPGDPAYSQHTFSFFSAFHCLIFIVFLIILTYIITCARRSTHINTGARRSTLSLYSVCWEILSAPASKGGFSRFALFLSLPNFCIFLFGFWVFVCCHWDLLQMGCSRDPCTDSARSLHGPNASYAFSVTADYDDGDSDELRDVGLLKKMIREFGLGCLIPVNPRQSSKGKGEMQRDDEKNSLEHNKAWLLAESGGCGAELSNAEPQSVHSSFRFSFCSQVELESLNMNSSNAATVLMVNLDNGLTRSRSKEMKWRRIESLERSISPVANTLIRFGYAEIVSATRNFSKGIPIAWSCLPCVLCLLLVSCIKIFIFEFLWLNWVGRVLGRGALSCVFRGRVGFLRTAVAIKRLDKEDKESAKAFCRELMIASSLQNPNIVPLVGFCIDAEEGLFLVYKYVSGGSLERHLHGIFQVLC